MLALNLNDICDKNINYGILLCGNDSVTVGIIQDKIIEIDVYKRQIPDQSDPLGKDQTRVKCWTSSVRSPTPDL